MIYAALNNVLDQITDSSSTTSTNRAANSTAIRNLLEALLQLLSVWHVTGFCETTPSSLIPRITQCLTICRAHNQRTGVRPSEIRDRWPPPAFSQQQSEDVLIKLAIKLAYNLKKSHSSTDLARSVFWTHQFRTSIEEADHGINTYNPDTDCPIRLTYNRMMTTFKLLRKSRIGSQLLDELRLKSDSIAEYKMSFTREIVEFHTAVELIRNHEESVICQPILGELWDRIFLRIQNFFTQLAIYQNIDKSWCSSMARMVGLYCHTVLMIHARYGALLRIIESMPDVNLRHNSNLSIGTDEELADFHLPGRPSPCGGSVLASPIPTSRTPQSANSQDLSPGGRLPSVSLLEEEVAELANSLLCMSPIAYSKISKIVAKCSSAERLFDLLGAAEMWPDGSIPASADSSILGKGVENGKQWLGQRLNNSQAPPNTVFDGQTPHLDYETCIWISLKMRLATNCYTLDAKWLNVMVSVVGDVCLQYAEGLILVPDMIVKGQKWIYSPSYLDWVKESKEFITMKFTQLQMRTMLRAHSIILRDTQQNVVGRNNLDQSLERLQDQFIQKFAMLEAKAEQTVQSAVDDLRELSDSVMQLLRHIKTNNSKASESSQHELVQRELQTETSEDGGAGGEGSVESARCIEDPMGQLMGQETQIAQVRLELEDLREWVNGMYSELSARISALSLTEKKSSSDIWLAHEVNKIKATLAEYVESTRLQLFLLQNSIRDLQKERTPFLRRHLSDTTNMQENTHGPDAALDESLGGQAFFVSEDAKFGAEHPDRIPSLVVYRSQPMEDGGADDDEDEDDGGDDDLNAFSSQLTKSSSACSGDRCQTRSTDDALSHALLTYIRSSVSVAAAAAFSPTEFADEIMIQPRGGLASTPTVVESSNLLERIDAVSADSDARSLFGSDRRHKVTTGSLFEQTRRSVLTTTEIHIGDSPLHEAPPPYVIMREEDLKKLQSGILVGVAALLTNHQRRRRKKVRFSRQLDIIRTSDLSSSSGSSGRAWQQDDCERHTTSQTANRSNWLKSWKQAKVQLPPRRPREERPPKRAAHQPRLVLISRLIKKNVPNSLNWDWGSST